MCGWPAAARVIVGRGRGAVPCGGEALVGLPTVPSGVWQRCKGRAGEAVALSALLAVTDLQVAASHAPHSRVTPASHPSQTLVVFLTHLSAAAKAAGGMFCIARSCFGARDGLNDNMACIVYAGWAHYGLQVNYVGGLTVVCELELQAESSVFFW